MKLIFENWRSFTEEQDPVNESILGTLFAAGAKYLLSSNWMKNKLIKLTKNLDMPSAHRAFAKFLLFSKTPMTAEFLTPEEKKGIEKVALEVLGAYSSPGALKDITKKTKVPYKAWRTLSRRESPEQYKEVPLKRRRYLRKKRGVVQTKQDGSALSKELFINLQRTFGECVVSLDRSGYLTLIDYYDFNDKKKLSDIGQLAGDLLRAIAPQFIDGDTLYQAARRLAPYAQAAGAGYPVKIKFKVSAQTLYSLSSVVPS